MSPRFAAAALCLSMSLAFSQSDSNDSLEGYRKELLVNPANSLAHYRIGQILFDQEDWVGAANEFREALSGNLQPRWIESSAHFRLGKIFEQSGQYDRAVNEYAQAQRTRNDTDVRVEGPDPFHTKEPEYSDEGRLAGLEGTVLLTAAIADDGLPRDLRVTRSLGLGLDEKAIDAARAWRFLPGTYQGASPANMAVSFLLPSKQSRWHLVRVGFRPPPGASRPVFLSAKYPLGSGVYLAAIDEARIVAAVGRLASATLSFDVDEQGVPARFRVDAASAEVWGNQAIALVTDWRFKPGMKNGTPISVPCTFDLVWGQRNLTATAIEQLLKTADTPKRLAVKVIYQSEPSYSAEARSAKLEGTVTISLIVSEDGTPRDLHVVKPLGLGLDEKAVEAVSQWRFQPTAVNGQSAPIPATVEVNFQLR